jgi:hypothetical protein
MESESRVLQNDGLLKLVVVVVDSVLADLVPSRVGPALVGGFFTSSCDNFQN